MKKWFLTFIIFVFLVACSKQELPQFTSEIKQTEQDLAQLQSCLGFRPYDHQLSHQGTLKLFECNKWHLQFPNLYKALTEIKVSDWDYIMSPIDDAFFNDLEGRKKFLGLLKDLDQKKSIDNLGSVGRRVFKTALLPLMARTENKEAWGKIVKVLGLPQEKRNILFNFSQALVSTIGKSETSLKKNLYPVFKLPGIQPHKDWLYDFLAKRYRAGNLNQDLAVFGEFFNQKAQPFWFYSWVKDPTSSSEIFQKIFVYSVFQAPNVKDDVRFLQKTLRTGLNCNQQNQKNYVDVKPEIASIVEFLKTSTRADFFEKQLDHKAKLSIFSNFCTSIDIDGTENKQFIPVFERLFDTVEDFFQERHQYDWIKGLHQASSVSGNPFYFVDFLAGTFFEKVENISRYLNDEDTETLFPAIFDLFKNVPLKDYPAVYQFMKSLDDPEIKEIISEWMGFWLTLSSEERLAFYDLMEIYLAPEFHTYDVLSNYTKTFVLFPNLTNNLKKSYFDENGNEEKLVLALQHLASKLSQKDVMTELSEFYSEKHMGKVIRALTYGLNDAPTIQVSSQEEEDVFVPFVINEDEKRIKTYATCIDDIRNLEKKGMAYYELIASYPISCMKINDGAITHKLFIWFKTIDTIYAQNYGDQYVLFDRNGILKNESLSQILNAMLVINEAYLQSNRGLTLHDMMGDLKTEILEKENYLVIEPVLRMLGHFYASEHVNLKRFYQTMISKVTKVSDQEIKKFLTPMSQYVVDLKNHESILETNVGKKDCRDLNPNLGVNPCLNTKEIKQGMRKLWSFVFKRYDGAAPMLEELAAMLHPAGGMEIPYPSIKGVKHTITLEEIVRFFHHMSMENDKRTFVYKTENSESKVSVDTLSQLEVVIRDIGFLNDFYGAYFKNTVASAKVYKTQVEKLKSQVNLMESSGDFLRRTKVFPLETKWKLSNIKESYNSLIHVDDEFPLGNKSYKYGPMMQSILALVTKTSAPDVQNFTAFWFPNDKFGLRHQGRFLTEFVNISGMRHISQFLENRFGQDVEKAINIESFKRINAIPARFHLEKLQATLRILADKYAKNENDVFYEMSDDLVEWVATLSYGELRIVEGALINTALLLSYNDSDSLDSVLDVLEVFFELYRPLKASWPKEKKVFEVVQDIATFLEVAVKRVNNSPNEQKWINQVFNVLKSMTLDNNKAGLEILVQSVKSNPSVWIQDVLDFVTQAKKLGSSWNLSQARQFNQTFTMLLGHPHLDFSGLKSWLLGTTIDPKHDLELLRLSHFLTQTLNYEGQKRTRFYVAIDELLNKEGQTLETLLKTASSVFSFK
ncbi:MAG: hypothetical protein ACOYL6_04880 [Bacteriovoracaceae bacterium]